MTQLKSIDYFDEFENQFRIQQILLKPKYQRPFKFLYERFNMKYLSINIKELQLCLGIVGRYEAHDILEGFVVLNLLTKHKQGGTTRYTQKNKDWWDLFLRLKEKEAAEQECQQRTEGTDGVD